MNHACILPSLRRGISQITVYFASKSSTGLLQHKFREMRNLRWFLWYCPSFWGVCRFPAELSDLCREYLSLGFIKIVWKIKIFWKKITKYHISLRKSWHTHFKYHNLDVMKCYQNSRSIFQHQSRSISNKMNLNMLFARCPWLCEK